MNELPVLEVYLEFSNGVEIVLLQKQSTWKEIVFENNYSTQPCIRRQNWNKTPCTCFKATVKNKITVTFNYAHWPVQSRMQTRTIQNVTDKEVLQLVLTLIQDNG
jgi:hypothetical protein